MVFAVFAKPSPVPSSAVPRTIPTMRSVLNCTMYLAIERALTTSTRAARVEHARRVKHLQVRRVVVAGLDDDRAMWSVSLSRSCQSASP